MADPGLVSSLENVSIMSRMDGSSSHLDTGVMSGMSQVLTQAIEDVLIHFPQNPLTSSLACLWAWMLANLSQQAMITGVSVFLHEVTYTLFVLPPFIFQFIPYMKRYKIQGNHPEKAVDQWKAFKGVIFSQACSQLPLMTMPTVVVNSCSISSDWESMPRWYVLVAQLYVCALCDDTWHYFFHRLLHWRPLYQVFHKTHHTFHAPFGFVAEYAHPLEVLVLGLGFFIGPVLVCRHMLTLYAWIILRIWISVDTHCGYDLPYHPLKLIPLHADARFHDYHHSHFNANYASTFTHWDWLLGTDAAYTRHLAELKATSTETKKIN